MVMPAMAAEQVPFWGSTRSCSIRLKSSHCSGGVQQQGVGCRALRQQGRACSVERQEVEGVGRLPRLPPKQQDRVSSSIENGGLW